MMFCTHRISICFVKWSCFLTCHIKWISGTSEFPTKVLLLLSGGLEREIEGGRELWRLSLKEYSTTNQNIKTMSYTSVSPRGDAVGSTLKMLTHLIFTTILWDFTNKEIASQGSVVTCPRSHSQETGEPGFESILVAIRHCYTNINTRL